MAQRPVIYAIQASDASEHSVKLQEILLDLKTENRIKDYRMKGIDEGLAAFPDQVEEGDLILILLTSRLEVQKKQIENRFEALKSKQPHIKVAEILVDNVVYNNEFITFPADLRPIRNREDVDTAWKSIEESLNDLFPTEKKREHEERKEQEEREESLGNERLNAVKKHPDYQKLLKVKPSSMYLFGRFGCLALFALLFIFGTLSMRFVFFQGYPTDSIGDLVLFFIVVIGIVMFIYGIFKLLKLLFSTIDRMPVLIVDKRVSVSGGGQSSSASTRYYVTLQFNDGERREVMAKGKLYGMITKNDVGVGYIRDRYLLDFRRLEL